MRHRKQSATLGAYSLGVEGSGLGSALGRNVTLAEQASQLSPTEQLRLILRVPESKVAAMLPTLSPRPDAPNLQNIASARTQKVTRVAKHLATTSN